MTPCSGCAASRARSEAATSCSGSRRSRTIFCTAAVWIVCTSSLTLAAGGSRIVLGTEPHLSKGAIALLFGNYDEGIRLTKLGLGAPPDWSDRSGALSNLCAGFAGAAAYDQAIKHCTSAIAINESNWQAYNNRAIAFIGLGLAEEAQEDINRGLELNPESTQLLKVQQLVRNTLTD